MMEAVLHDIFLELYKEYYALYWDRFIVILAAYGVVPRSLRILWMYWAHITMVAKSGGYYLLPFKVYHGETQVDPLYLNIFNMVLDVVIRH